MNFPHLNSAKCPTQLSACPINRYYLLGSVIALPLGPIIVNVALFHILVAPGNYGLTVVIYVLALITLIGTKDLLRAIFAR